jgi:hypothetical protein
MEEKGTVRRQRETEQKISNATNRHKKTDRQTATYRQRIIRLIVGPRNCPLPDFAPCSSVESDQQRSVIIVPHRIKTIKNFINIKRSNRNVKGVAVTSTKGWQRRRTREKKKEDEKDETQLEEGEEKREH